MKKLITAVLFFVFASTFFFSSEVLGQSPNPQPETIDINAVFWPIVPGKTVADPMFWAKQFKESFDGFFKSGEVNKSKYQIDLSEKRLVEANKLVQDKDYGNALKSLNLNKARRDQAVELKRKAQEKNKDVNELTPKLVKSLENQLKAYSFLQTQFPANLQDQIKPMISDLSLQISEAK